MSTLSDNQLAALLRKAGVGAGDAAYLVAISHPESSADPAAVQQGQPYATTGWGLWQITPGDSEPGIATDDGLLNPQKNADAAAAKLKSQGLDAWTTYTSGKYQPYFAQAESAVASVYGMPISKVDSLAASAGTGGSAATSGNAGSLTTGGLLSGTGNLIHGTAVVLDRAFSLFAPGQGWRIAFGAGAVAFGFLSFRAFTGGGHG